MTTEKTYEQVLIGLGTVLLLVKEMHLELIGQIEALPLDEKRQDLIRELMRRSEGITRESILERIRHLYPDTAVMNIKRQSVEETGKKHASMPERSGDYAR